MNTIKNLIGLLYLLAIVAGCGSTNTVNNNSTTFVRNFQASYFDTWDAVNEVIKKEQFRVVERDKDNGVIILKPLPNVEDKIKLFETIKIAVIGSDKISAVQIISEFISHRGLPEINDNRNNRIITSSVPEIEKAKSDGTFEFNLFEKIVDALKIN